ncbi:uncharacterized protein LOC142560910 isoform X2 [Dermacentor variabilis]|uniref:uncharacterized protein LOC142560910 isoform X2 n=1 Tax=Dermacentor variabilis TaxID=34621 RepID=UPI003F5C1A65
MVCRCTLKIRVPLQGYHERLILAIVQKGPKLNGRYPCGPGTYNAPLSYPFTRGTQKGPRHKALSVQCFLANIRRLCYLSPPAAPRTLAPCNLSVKAKRELQDLCLWRPPLSGGLCFFRLSTAWHSGTSELGFHLERHM